MKKRVNFSSFVFAFVFGSFLGEKRVVDSYLANYEKTTNFPVFNFLNNSNPSSFISGAFEWSSTPQGHAYWSKLNADWLRIVNTLSF